ncbi:hypothetical protein CAEBREN_10096 [Caenorhabditis brenneri]|uniref:F-box domain-containing protein n=1 Tax=Caenorhabditis brenneri TaxID=135651 RepID=G0N0A9_CAEBE|nr:hypothetical protein CAEBREN_10096 [Caenorhabditis brenneri]
MAVAPSFPLYELPKDELRWVIRFMDPNALFKLSLLSKRSKNLVTSRNWKALRITILVSQTIQIRSVPSFLGLQECVDFDFNNRVLKMLVPKKVLLVSTTVFENKTALQKALVQNIDELDINNLDEKLTLDGLLCSNSKRIRSDVWRISPNVLNKFLKLWKSGSNFRLEQLCVLFVDLQGLDVIMKGIPHRVVPREQNEQRRFKLSNRRIEALEGEGMDFHRFDGTKATVCIKERDTWAFIYFYVWHDHCVVNNIL